MRRYYFESPLVRLKDEPIWTAHRRRASSSRRPLRRRLRQRRRPDRAASRGPDQAAALRRHPALPVDRDPALLRRRVGRLRRRRGASDRAVRQGAERPDPAAADARLPAGRQAPDPPARRSTTASTEADFKVYLVAHSMGGLVCRAFLQNPELGSAAARAAVDKLFTYATPHNGIDLRIVRNVPGWSAFGERQQLQPRADGRLPRACRRTTEDVSTTRRISRPSACSTSSAPTPPTTWWCRASRPGRSARPATAWCGWRTPPPSARRRRAGRSIRRAPTPTAATPASTASSIPRRASRTSPASCSAASASTASSTSSTSPCPTEVQEAYDRDNDRCAPRTGSRSSPRCAAASGSCTAASVRENSAIHRTYDELFPKGADGKRGAEPRSTARTCSRSSSTRPRARGPAPERRPSPSTWPSWFPTTRSTACSG